MKNSKEEEWEELDEELRSRPPKRKDKKPRREDDDEHGADDAVADARLWLDRGVAHGRAPLPGRG